MYLSVLWCSYHLENNLLASKCFHKMHKLNKKKKKKKLHAISSYECHYD